MNPLSQTQKPASQPAYAAGPPPTQEYPPPQQQEANGLQSDPLPADGDRGLGKVGGGLLAAAGGLLAGAIVKHEIDEHKSKHMLNFLSAGGKPGGSGLFGGIGSSLPFGNSNAPQHTNRPSGGGLFGGMASGLPFGNSNAPQLHIHCAAFADKDVTQAVRRLVTPAQSFEINTAGLWNIFGDPWPDNRKQFSILYSYGQRPWEVVATSEFTGTLSILPHQPLDKNRMEFVQDPRARVVAVIWGKGNGLEGGKGRMAKMQEIETTGEFQATNDWMGFDGMCGPAKTAVVYYRTGGGGVGVVGAREGMTCRLPWNPLARWT